MMPHSPTQRPSDALRETSGETCARCLMCDAHDVIMMDRMKLNDAQTRRVSVAAVVGYGVARRVVSAA